MDGKFSRRMDEKTDRETLIYMNVSAMAEGSIKHLPIFGMGYTIISVNHSVLWLWMYDKTSTTAVDHI